MGGSESRSCVMTQSPAPQPPPACASSGSTAARGSIAPTPSSKGLWVGNMFHPQLGCRLASKVAEPGGFLQQRWSPLSGIFSLGRLVASCQGRPQWWGRPVGQFCVARWSSRRWGGRWLENLLLWPFQSCKDPLSPSPTRSLWSGFYFLPSTLPDTDIPSA